MLPLYASAVIIACATGEAAQSTVTSLSAVFLLLRVAYIWAYAQDKAALRLQYLVRLPDVYRCCLSPPVKFASNFSSFQPDDGEIFQTIVNCHPNRIE